jgi:hypothetical protein
VDTPEGEFQAHPDRVTFTRSSGKQTTRQVRPDGFAWCTGEIYLRLLLEVDRATEDNPRFGRRR